MNQTEFTDNQEILQPPPTEAPSSPLTTEPVLEVPPLPPSKSKPKSRKKLLLLTLIIFLVFLLLLILLTFLKPRQSTSPQTTQSPFPSISTNPLTASQSAYTNLLFQIKTQIDQSDPTIIDFNPPPINYQLEL